LKYTLSPVTARREGDQNFQKEWANYDSDIRRIIHRVKVIIY